MEKLSYPVTKIPVLVYSGKKKKKHFSALDKQRNVIRPISGTSHVPRYIK